MPPEVAENRQPTPPQARPESAMAHEAQSAWAPGTNFFKLGAVCNDTYNQSLAHQYDDVAEHAINGIGNGVRSMLGLGAFGLEVVGDAASVVTADLQIGYEKLTYPALAEVHSDELAQNMRQMGAKYESAFQPLRQGYESMEKDLNDIGAQSTTDGKAYARLLTDPAGNIANAIDKFTGQTPGTQVEAIFDQGTQVAAFGLAEKALAGVLSTAQIAAKFDQLLAKMDDSLNRIRAAGSQTIKGSEIEYAGVPSDHFVKGETENAPDYLLKMAGKRPDFIKNLDKLEDVLEVRSDFRIPNTRNIAIAEVNIAGKEEKLIGISGLASPDGTCPLPEKPVLKFEPRGFEERNDHSEFKILNQIAQRLDRSATGTVKLFSERYPCDSCEPAIDEFRRLFQNITLEIEYGMGKR